MPVEMRLHVVTAVYKMMSLKRALDVNESRVELTCLLNLFYIPCVLNGMIVENNSTENKCNFILNAARLTIQQNQAQTKLTQNYVIIEFVAG